MVLVIIGKCNWGIPMQLFALPLIFLIVMTLVLIIGLFYLKGVVRNKNMGQDDILARHAGQAKQGQWYRVHYASEKRFRRWQKLFPWQATGIMFVNDQGISFCYQAKDKTESIIRFTPGQFELHWVGIRYLPNGAMPWFCLTVNNTKHYFTADSGMTIINARRLTTDVYQQIRLVFPQLGAPEPKNAASGFALEKNPFSFGAMILIAVLGLYAFIDYMLNLEVFVIKPEVADIVIISLLSVPIAYAVMQKAGVPFTEGMGLAILLGVMLGLAIPPAMLRINQITSDGLQSYQYRLNPDLKLIPVDYTGSDLPELHFPGDREYWEHFEEGSRHEFYLRKGEPGFYQLDMAPVYKKMRKYYIEKRKAESKEE